MGLIITKGIPETYKLMESDPSGETYVIFKPATVAEHAMREEIVGRTTRTFHSESDAVDVRSESTAAQRQAREVFITMVGCNIMVKPKPDAEAKELFTFGKTPDGEPFLNMTQAAFLNAWGSLPQSVAEEIWHKCLEKNPQWSPFV